MTEQAQSSFTESDMDLCLTEEKSTEFQMNGVLFLLAYHVGYIVFRVTI